MLSVVRHIQKGTEGGEKKANEKNVNIKRAGFRTQNYIHNRMNGRKKGIKKNSQLCGISKQTKQ